MLDKSSFHRLFPGPFNFFRATPLELHQIIPNPDQVLPTPQRIFLEKEEATPLHGFPILVNSLTLGLDESLIHYVEAEEIRQIAALNRRPGNQKAVDDAWDSYRKLLESATENAVRSSFGRKLPSIFWLYHSGAVAHCFRDSPRRAMRQDLSLGKMHGDLIKYRTFDRYLDRVLTLTFDVVHRVAEEAEEDERELFPALLVRMRDNVLSLTEDHVSRDLSELDSYMRGHLRLDPKDFRNRLSLLADWSSEKLQKDEGVGTAAHNLVGRGVEVSAHKLLGYSGWVRYLSQHPSYNERALLDSRQVVVWENLLHKLKEFEVLAALRRLVIPVQKQGDRLSWDASKSASGGRRGSTLVLSDSTRPLDFSTSWVIDPLVRRFGLIYDITDFSSIVSVLGRSGSEDQDRSYRSIFRFQRRVNQMAREHRLQLEKYLGDGALYSGRHPHILLFMAIQLQRYYKRALNEGFPFDRGMRIGLNHGEYRLLPIEEGGQGKTHRYEFFGHGIVELSRLATGKATREIDDIKTLLLGLGYPQPEVERFFAPLERQNVDLVDKTEEARQFYCYIDKHGALVNEGIAATEQFISELSSTGMVQPLYRLREDKREYLVLELPLGNQVLLVGIRELGRANLKGLEKGRLYEVVDGEPWKDLPRQEEGTRGSLLDSLKGDFGAPLGASKSV
jgi:hypothetical protein